MKIQVINEKKVNFRTSVYLREKVAFNPFFLVSFLSVGVKQALKAPGNDWNRDLNMPNVRIWNQRWHNKPLRNMNVYSVCISINCFLEKRIAWKICTITYC